MAKITDGASNTMMVAEQSDWCLNGAGAQVDCSSDGGFGGGNEGGYSESYANGVNEGDYTFLAGFFHNDGNTRVFNTTTVRAALNNKSALAPGVSWNGAWQACNNPLQSAHSGGVNSVSADGSVHFLLDQIPLDVLYHLADAADGNPIPDVVFR
jgi:hypothetical protein